MGAVSSNIRSCRVRAAWLQERVSVCCAACTSCGRPTSGWRCKRLVQSAKAMARKYHDVEQRSMDGSRRLSKDERADEFHRLLCSDSDLVLAHTIKQAFLPCSLLPSIPKTICCRECHGFLCDAWQSFVPGVLLPAHMQTPPRRRQPLLPAPSRRI